MADQTIELTSPLLAGDTITLPEALNDGDTLTVTVGAGLIGSAGVEAMGIVAWSGRSPGWWPANSGLPIGPAATVTVPSDAVSGLVRVVEGS